MIILIGGEKGGTGKSTIATNLAALVASSGGDVLLVDTDPQGSASEWAGIREDSNKAPITVIQKRGKIARDILDLSERFDTVIIDAGGRDSIELRQAMGVADVMFTPLQASQFDIATLATLEEVYSLVDATRGVSLPIYAFINRASPNPLVNEYKEAQAIVGEYDCFRLCETVIRDRITFRKAASEGYGVHEMDRLDTKATYEISNLFKEVMSHAHEKIT
ncbi:MAG: AAA family ATPase [Gammaproteobacteria bacterium]|nr:AAA family ATPase [Gammaproteobacteria bacterium]